MTLELLRQKFEFELDGLYSKEEIQSFFLMMMAHFINKSRVEIALQPQYKVKQSDLSNILYGLGQLKLEVPIQHLLGVTNFMGLDFEVNGNVLIPRPETEELVSWILAESDQSQPLKILDIGTGSGCIAISLLKNLPLAQITALDSSDTALKVAERNAEKNQVKLHFIHFDILREELPEEQFDIIVSNPPYVREMEKKQMQNNVLKYEPSTALFVKDSDPLLFYRKIAKLSLNHLKPQGKIFFEINQYLGKEMFQLMKSTGFEKVQIKQDIYGNDRMLRAVKN